MPKAMSSDRAIFVALWREFCQDSHTDSSFRRFAHHHSEVGFSTLDGLLKFGRHLLLVFEPLLQPFADFLSFVDGEGGDGGFDFCYVAHVLSLAVVVHLGKC